MKKTIITVVALMLAISMVTVCAFAAPGKGNNGNNGNNGRGNRGNERPNAAQRADRERPFNRGNMPQFDRPMMGFDFEDISSIIEEKLGELTDAETKANIEKLLEAYKNAYEALNTAIENESDADSIKELRFACQNARKALEDAIKDAGLEMKQAAKDIRRFDMAIRKLDAEDVAERINSLEDGETKTALLALLDNYNAALEAFETAIENDETADDALESLKTAFEDAKNTLEEAMREADIARKAPAPDRQNDRRPNKASRKLDIEKIEEQIAAVEDADAKAKLESLLAAYVEAYEAEEKAFAEDSEATDDELKALNDAVKTAEKELQTALRESGVKYSDYKSANDNKKPEDTENTDNTEKPTESDNKTEDKGIFGGIFNWFGKLFN